MLICTFLPLFSFFGCCIFAGVNGSSPLTTYGRVRPRNTQPSSHNQIMKTQQQPHTGRYAHGNTPPPCARTGKFEWDALQLLPLGVRGWHCGEQSKLACFLSRAAAYLMESQSYY